MCEIASFIYIKLDKLCMYIVLNNAVEMRAREVLLWIDH